VCSYTAGPDRKSSHQLSCVCLHGDRKPQERKNNLERFKVGIDRERERERERERALWGAVSQDVVSVCVSQKKDVRHLICTDVAARGIDIHGVPYGEGWRVGITAPTKETVVANCDDVQKLVL